MQSVRIRSVSHSFSLLSSDLFRSLHVQITVNCSGAHVLENLSAFGLLFLSHAVVIESVFFVLLGLWSTLVPMVPLAAE